MKERNRVSSDGQFVPQRDVWGRWRVGRKVETKGKPRNGNGAGENEGGDEPDENNFRHSHFVSDVGFQFPDDLNGR